MSTIIIILIGMVVVSVLIIVLLAKSNKSLKREVSKDEEQIRYKDHIIHEVNGVMLETGKIKRESDAKKNKVNTINNSSDMVELFNKL